MTLRDEFENHWRQIFEDLRKTACIFKHILIFQMFLKCKLLEDYVEKPHVVNKNIICLDQFMSESENCKWAAHELST